MNQLVHGMLLPVMPPLFLLFVILFIFWRGKRKLFIKLSGSVLFLTFLIFLIFPTPEDLEARKAGFTNASEQNEARLLGIAEGAVWKARKESLRQELERKKTEEEEKKKAQQDEEKRRIEQAKLDEKAENNRKGFHCLSSWDGSHRDFKNFVESQMRNPDSFEHIETKVTPVDSTGNHVVIMKYRAQNGFGGMNIGTALGTFSNKSCAFKLTAIE